MKDNKRALLFVLDKNLGLPINTNPWSESLSKLGIKTESTTNLVNIDNLINEHKADVAYVPGAEYCISVLKTNKYYKALVVATSKFTGKSSQNTLLVVRKDDPANSITDLAGASYGYMNKSCSSSYFIMPIFKPTATT